MHRTALLFGMICFILAGIGSFFVSEAAVDYLETVTEQSSLKTLQDQGIDWADVRADGMTVYLSGLAPNEAARFDALETLANSLQMERVVDEILIAKNTKIKPPRFSLEMLRNEDRISLIGLIPQSTGRDFILNYAKALSDNIEIADMLETADHPVDDAWAEALHFGLDSLKKLPRSKISITQEAVDVTAVTESVVEKKSTERDLTRNKPKTVRLRMDISSPRPVISPFTYRLSITDGTPELTACSADTELTKSKIIRALRKIGFDGPVACEIGLGVPTTDWADALAKASGALLEIGGGVLTFTDSDVSLVAIDGTTQETFDQVIGDLENTLPELFSLHSVLPRVVVTQGNNLGDDAPEFVATKSPEGLVQLRGRVPTEATKLATDTYAKSLFGNDNVYLQTRVDEDLSPGWPLRILGGLEALSKLHHGSLIVRPDTVEIKGVGERPDVPSEVSRALSVRIGGKGNYKIDVKFDENLFVVNAEPTPQECERGISAVLVRNKINFAPSSAKIDAASLRTITEIADVLRKCPDAKFEIEGHTDSQGREELNNEISQRRAESVLSALLGQRILTSGISAKGYGPTQPIADNKTEGGRAANRRIAFRLVEDVEASVEETKEEGSE